MNTAAAESDLWIRVADQSRAGFVERLAAAFGSPVRLYWRRSGVLDHPDESSDLRITANVGVPHDDYG